MTKGSMINFHQILFNLANIKEHKISQAAVLASIASAAYKPVKNLPNCTEISCGYYHPDDDKMKVVVTRDKSTIVVSFRGTANATNWWTNLMVRRVPWHQHNLPYTESDFYNNWYLNKLAMFNRYIVLYALKSVVPVWEKMPCVHSGFSNCYYYTSGIRGANPPDSDKPQGKIQVLPDHLQAVLHQKIEEARTEKTDQVDVYFTGHSLGGALATLATYHWANAKKSECDPGGSKQCEGFEDISLKGVNIHLYTFGSPRVGSSAFRSDFDSLKKTKHIATACRFINTNDIVPRLPTRITGYTDWFHVGEKFYISSSLDTSVTSSSRTQEDIWTIHDMTHYQKGVDHLRSHYLDATHGRGFFSSLFAGVIHHDVNAYQEKIRYAANSMRRRS